MFVLACFDLLMEIINIGSYFNCNNLDTLSCVSCA